uniref:Cilia- and flagella-associated protein 418 n=1 Tax=Daphnia galeata TaxID=27404 RepID=A0A8J2RQA6_9CRUS|nr:unnamed protein product [Daphnia galeata]
MADDIEDLLREVEEKYLPRSSNQDKNNPSSISQFKSSYPTVIQIEKKSGDQSIVKTTTRAHSSDIVFLIIAWNYRCRELEDELSDLLDEAGGMSDAAAVGLRCKRSPRRSASARELIGGKFIASSSTADAGNKMPSVVADKRQEFANKMSSSSSASAAAVAGSSNKSMTGVRSAPPFVQHHSNFATRTTNVSIDAVVVEKQKCYPIYVSGVIDSIDNVQSVRVCGSLRCTGCDFRVSQFAHYRWRPGTDYLFLRNHMPEFDRVRVKLSTAKFCRAYACQCKFVTVKDLVDLNKLGQEFASTWICLGH